MSGWKGLGSISIQEARSMDEAESRLSVLREEYATVGVGDEIYSEIRNIVKAAVRGGNYPPMYSPTRIWDEEAFYTLANDFIVEKLHKRNYLAYLLQASTSMRAFRKSIESVFIRFLISKKKRTVFDNLFGRASLILSGDSRFKCFMPSPKKAHSQWGLSAWNAKEVFNSREEDLIKVGLALGGFKAVEYRLDARKISHIVSNKELADYIYHLFVATDSLLILPQILTVLKYRFNLLEVAEVSLEEPVSEDEEGNILTMGDTLATPEPSTATLETDEAAREVLLLLSPRQKQIFTEFQEYGATLLSVGENVGCSKSTVDNELRYIYSSISEVVDDEEQARAVYRRMLEILEEKN
jgi:hypothetical protein